MYTTFFPTMLKEYCRPFYATAMQRRILTYAFKVVCVKPEPVQVSVAPKPINTLSDIHRNECIGLTMHVVSITVLIQVYSQHTIYGFIVLFCVAVFVCMHATMQAGVYVG